MMIQINVLESIATDLKCSIGNIKESGKKLSFANEENLRVKIFEKTSQIVNSGQENFKTNVDTDEIFLIMDNLSREGKTISKSMIGCQENDFVIGKKFSLRELNNLCFGMTETNLIEDFQLELLKSENFKNRNRWVIYQL